MEEIDAKKIFEAKQALNNFLEEHPELKPYQDRIDEAMKKAGDNPHNRMAVLESMFLEQRDRLAVALKECLQELQVLKEKLNKIDELSKLDK